MRGPDNHLGVRIAAWLVAGGGAVLMLVPPPVFQAYAILLLAHFVVAGFLAGALWYVFRQTAGGRAWVALGGLFALAVPVLGPLASGCLLLPLQPLLARLRPDLEGPGTPEEEGTPLPSSRKARQAEADLQAYLDIEPYADLLWSPDATVKKSVINAIAEQPSPKLISLLRWCLSDPRPEVYQLALAKLGKIQKHHADEILLATERTRSYPDSIQAHRGLAEAYERFAESGLVEGTLQQYSRQMALASFQAILAREPGNSTALEAIARLAVAAGRVDEALTAYETLLRETGSASARLGMLKVWHERTRLSGDQEALHRLCGAVAEWKAAPAGTERSGQDGEAFEHFEWWMGRGSDG